MAKGQTKRKGRTSSSAKPTARSRRPTTKGKTARKRTPKRPTERPQAMGRDEERARVRRAGLGFREDD